VPQQRSYPSSASLSVAELVSRTPRSGKVVAAGPLASYVALPDLEEGDVVIALLAPGAVRLPIGVCVPDGPLPALGESVDVGNGLIVAAGAAWRPVRWWDPRPHLDPAALLAGADVLARVVHAEPVASFGLPPAITQAVATALANGDGVPARCVLGLGPGLTPAGDDVVAGSLAVLAMIGRLDDSVRAAVQAHARARTTALSSALVAAAGRGEMIPQAARLLTSVAAGQPAARVADHARRLFAVGSTSGRDLAAGMAEALRAAA